LQYISADGLEDGTELDKLDSCDAILVPGGFGSRGMEGKIRAVTYARERKIPFFGICLGMQLAVVEFARNIAKIEGAHSVEFNQVTPHPVIYLMTEWFDFRTGQIEKRDQHCDMGGTLRLGAYPCVIKPGTFAACAYGQDEISERHRHRYEFNNTYRQQLEEAGLIVSGASPDGNLVEIVELADHPWFLGCQFHPEFQSKPMRPHPLFRDFIKAAIAHKKASKA
jgi:CTP synthase